MQEIEVKEKNRTEQGGINMCKALQEWMERERREGMEQGESRKSLILEKVLAELGGRAREGLR